ncbi:MAG: FG-GAP-like repeat-containing protein, partial [Phycisphaerales bacterium]|nr:FG-GAP-like repeat-containing protein [Phycisphaerales bacterium]
MADDQLAVAMSYDTYIYELVGGSLWEQTQVLGTDGSDVRLSMSGDRLLIGESNGTTYAGEDTTPGQARIFRDVAGIWVQQATLVPVDNQPSDQYGVSVALDGDVAVVTATAHNGSALRGGTAIVFEDLGSTWEQTSKIHARDAVAEMGFGTTAAVAGRSVLAGWQRVENGYPIPGYSGAQVCTIPTSSWATPEGGAFDDPANWVPQAPSSGTAHMSLPAAFDVSLAGTMSIDTLMVGTSRPRLTGGSFTLGDAGSGLLQIGGSQSFTGALALTEASIIDGDVVIGQTSQPGLLEVELGASLSVTGALDIDRDAELRVPLTNTLVPVQVGGLAALGGTLSASLSPGLDPDVGTSWCLMELSSVNAESKFPVVVLPGVGANKYLEIVYGTGLHGGLKIIATVASISDLGDLNQSGSDVVSGRADDIAVADFGSSAGGPDGNDDIALAIPGSPGVIMILISDGLGGVSSQVLLNVCDDPTGLATGDFDADGKSDLVFVSPSEDAVFTLLNSGTQPSEMVLSAGTNTSIGPVDVAVIRLDGDLEDDIIVACAGTGDVLWDGSLYGQIDVFEHGGSGLSGPFSFKQTLQVSGKPGQVKPGSVGSGKGSRRAAATLEGLNELVLLSEEAGIWSELQRVPVGSDPHDLIMNDLDGDGFDDVLVGNRGSNTISVLLGGVDGLLGDQQIFQVGEGPQSLTALDYDDDGDLDLAVLTVDGLSTEGGVSIYRNDQESGDADLTFGLEQTLHDGEVVLLLGAG